MGLTRYNFFISFMKLVKEIVDRRNNSEMKSEKESKTIDILGTEYSVIPKKYGDADIDGESELFSKVIFLREDNTNKISDFLEVQKSVLRHEVIHAFMYESGLGFNWTHGCETGHDETVIDWFAIQSPKIFKVFDQLGIL